MSEDIFERVIAETLASLDRDLADRLDNVVVAVEQWADQQTLRLSGVQSPLQLLGFYHGVPLSNRTHSYSMVTPDKISIYRGPIERRCRTEEELRSTIRRVLLHEIAHHFGMDDQQLRDIGAY